VAQRRRSLDEIADALNTIDHRVEPIAIRHPEGSDISVIAYAIRNLVLCVERPRAARRPPQLRPKPALRVIGW